MSSSNVTIVANDGYRHFLKNTKILQVLGVTLTGVGGTAALRGGIELTNRGTLAYFEDVIFTQNRNTATGVYGGALRVNTRAQLNTISTSFVNNRGYFAGAVLVYNFATMIMDYAEFYGNQATYDGGALELLSNGNMAITSGGTFQNNTAYRYGGAIYVTGSTLNVSSINCIKNKATATGGSYGACAYIGESSTYNDAGGSVYSYNVAGYDGGAFYFSSSTATFSSYTSITYNQAKARYGGGFDAQGSTTTVTFADNALIANNSALDAAAFLATNAKVTFSWYSTITGNNATTTATTPPKSAMKLSSATLIMGG